MTMNPLPPQAYTKDTLLKAYAWLQNQTPNIKELASTPDVLVSLFLKAQRNGAESLQTPSIQNFKNELKSLAGIMGEFDNAPAKPAQNGGTHSIASLFPSENPLLNGKQHQESQRNASPSANNNESMATNASFNQNLASQPGLAQALDQVMAAFPKSAGMFHQPSAQFEADNKSAHAQNLISTLDPETREMIQEVKRALNLSTENEALRAAIKIGTQQLRQLIQK